LPSLYTTPSDYWPVAFVRIAYCSCRTWHSGSQLTVLKRKHRRPKISTLDKLFWVLAHRFWSAAPWILASYRPIKDWPAEKIRLNNRTVCRRRAGLHL
jgi:hypothetical protein